MAKVCDYCGAPVDEGRKFCSKECMGKAFAENYRLKVDADYAWKKISDKWECRYNEGCACRNRQCARCGWNPAVAQARMKKIMEAMV